LMNLLLKVPNIPFEDVPIWKDETENVILQKIWEIPEFDFKPKAHEEIWKNLGIINTERATEVAWSRFNYLIWDWAMLEYALANYAISVLTDRAIIENIIKEKWLNVSSKPFVPVIPPNFINPDVFLKMARLEPKEDRYFIESENLYLIWSGEHTLWPIHMNENLKEEDLPIRYFANTSCYRKEAWTYGKDMKWILRQHQFDKVEMLSYSTPDKSLDEHKLFMGIQEYLVKSLWLPYQQVLLCTWDMWTPNVRHVDIEVWLPSQDKYRETHSADYNTDYQSRRMNINTNVNWIKQFVHMNDWTAYALWRMIIAILENNQQEDWSVKIPEVLKWFMKKDKIEKKN
jgi:seryl-tRNA synthetase